MHQGQAHVRKAVVHIDPFVEEHDADGHQEVEQEPSGDAPVASHSVRKRCHNLRQAGALQPPTRMPSLSPAALPLLRRRHVLSGFTVWPGRGMHSRRPGRAAASAAHTCSATAHSAGDDAAARPARPAPLRPRPRGSGRPCFRPRAVGGAISTLRRRVGLCVRKNCVLGPLPPWSPNPDSGWVHLGLLSCCWTSPVCQLTHLLDSCSQAGGVQTLWASMRQVLSKCSHPQRRESITS